MTNPSVDSGSGDVIETMETDSNEKEAESGPIEHDVGRLLSTSEDGGDHMLGSRESLVSPAMSPASNASNGGIYSVCSIQIVTVSSARNFSSCYYVELNLCILIASLKLRLCAVHIVSLTSLLTCCQ